VNRQADEQLVLGGTDGLELDTIDDRFKSAIAPYATKQCLEANARLATLNLRKTHPLPSFQTCKQSVNSV